MKKWLPIILLAVAVLALYVAFRNRGSLGQLGLGLWHTVWGSLSRWATILAILPRGLIVVVAGLAVVVSLATVGIAALINPRARSARPTQMTFSGDPRQLRGTVRNPQPRPDGSWTIQTTDRQRAWLNYQARRQGIQPKEEHPS